MVAHVPEGVDPAKLLIVGDVMDGLRALGAAARARTRAKVIAVTGSVGKTTVKEMLRAALSPQGRTHAALHRVVDRATAVQVDLAVTRRRPEPRGLRKLLGLAAAEL